MPARARRGGRSRPQRALVLGDALPILLEARVAAQQARAIDARHAPGLPRGYDILTGRVVHVGFIRTGPEVPDARAGVACMPMRRSGGKRPPGNARTSLTCNPLISRAMIARFERTATVRLHVTIPAPPAVVLPTSPDLLPYPASRLVPRASRLVPRASRLVPRASRLALPRQWSCAPVQQGPRIACNEMPAAGRCVPEHFRCSSRFRAIHRFRARRPWDDHE
jgi:hypothetical protein